MFISCLTRFLGGSQLYNCPDLVKVLGYELCPIWIIHYGIFILPEGAQSFCGTGYTSLMRSLDRPHFAHPCFGHSTLKSALV